MGVQKRILKAGDGKTRVKAGDTIIMEYKGQIYDPATGSKGQEFDSSDSRGALKTVIGKGKVIKGWDEGILRTDGGMTLGEEAELIITSDYGYGDVGFPGSIPPGSTLIFGVKLIAINGKKA